MLKKMKSLKKRYWVLGILVLLIVVLVIKKQTEPAVYQEFAVEKIDVSDILILAGVIDVDNRVDMGFAKSGRVSEIYRQTGEEVKKGDLIARIDQNQTQSQLIEARANLDAVVVSADADSDGASSSLETSLVEQQEIVDGALKKLFNNDLQAYLANDDNTAQEITQPVITGVYTGTEEGEYRIETYPSGAPSGFSYRFFGLESGTSTGEVYKSGKLGNSGLYIQFDASANYANSQWVLPIPNTRSTSYVTYKTAYDTAVASQNRTIAALENSLAKISGSVSAGSLSKAQKEQAQAGVTAVYAQLKDGKIIAPFDGIVAKNNLEVGQIVSAYSPVVTVINSLEKELILNIPEIYIDKIEVGSNVEITLDAYENDVFSGVINYIDIIDTLVDGVPVYQTTVIFNEEDPRVRIGMNAKAQIITESVQDTLAVPMHFIQEDDGTSFVMVKEYGNLTRKDVQTGIRGSNGLVEIISGLTEGVIVVKAEE